MNDILQLSAIYNPYTLNIFSDASYKGHTTNNAAYAVACICQDTLIDEISRPSSNGSIVTAEGKGIRTALSMANKYKNQYKSINIFSDSEISVRAIKEYIYNWYYDPKRHALINTSNKVAKNQDIYLECMNLLDLLGLSNCLVKVYHVKGHVSNNYNDISAAAGTFIRENNIKSHIDLNIIRYICCYNDYVDKLASQTRIKYNRDKNTFNNPIKFVATEKIVKKYNI